MPPLDAALPDSVPTSTPDTRRRAGAESRNDPGVAETLRVVLWIALVTGFIEVVILGARKLALGEIIALSQHVVWMAPVGYAILLVPIGAALALLGRAGRLLRFEWLVGGIVLLAAIGIGSMFPRVHRAAMLVLALGIAVQAARVTARHPGAIRALVRRSIVPLAALIPLSAAIVFGALWMRERNLLAAVPTRSAAGPNVLLIILDTVRAANLSLYGYARPTTPHLERMATRGVVFERALATSPWTLPSHGTMFTGRYPHELSANWETPLDERYPTLAEVLAEHGYATAGFVANPFYGSWEHGLDRGFAHYEDYTVSLGQILNSTSLGALVFAGRPGFSHNIFRRFLNNYEYLGRKKADDLSADFLAWHAREPRRPYFAFLNYMDAHVPYTPPPDLAERFGVRPPPPLWDRIRNDNSSLTEEERRAGAYDRNKYDASIAEVDRALGAMFDSLDRMGALENTIVIITSDHGEHLGENGLYSHANSLYMPNLHVPLLLMYPGRVPAGGTRIRELVTLRSLPATILDLAGIENESRLPGESLAGLWSGGSAPDDPLLASVRQGINMTEDIPIARGGLASLVASEYQLIRNPGPEEELYDLSASMMNESDLSGTPRAAGVQAELRAALEQLVGSSADSLNGIGAGRR